MADADPLAKVESVYQRYVRSEAWQQAVQNRVQAASLAHTLGRTDLFRQYMQQAVEIAHTNNLDRLELGARIHRFNILMGVDLTGQILEELQHELTVGLLASGEAEVNGALIEHLERSGSEALAAYDDLLKSLGALAAPLAEKIDRARKKATAFDLNHLEEYNLAETLELLDKDSKSGDVREQIGTLANSARQETARICAWLRIDLFLLTAEMVSRRGSPENAEDIFRKAAQLSEDLPDKQVNVYMAWSDHADGCGKLKSATRYAQKAVEASRQISSVALKAQAAGKLDNLLARQAPEPPVPSPIPGEGDTDQVMRILDNAHHANLARRFDHSLQLIDQALERATSPHLRRAVLRVRSLTLFELGRFEDAETDLDACITLLSDELFSDGDIAAGAFDNRIQEEEILFLLKAFLKAKAGQSLESWNLAERGRAQRLKREISATKGSPDSMIGGGTFEMIRPWLRENRAAMLSFAATRWGTLALTAGPDDAAPEAKIFDQFKAGDLKRLLGPDQSVGSQDWNRIIFKAVPALSAGLIHGLMPRLRTIAQDAEVLYVIPDSYLYYAPFAALTQDTSPNSSTLIDLIPLAMTPSAEILLWSSSRAVATTSQCCLAVAVGRDTQGFEFHNHLRQVARAPWPTGQQPTELRDTAATVTAVASQAPQYSVVYFSCHGEVNQAGDLMAASQLKLADDWLRASEVATWKLNANLVFLNACQSGRFRLQARSDINGFLRAFPIAGARSIIAPVIHVNPLAAGDLAEEFFRAWLGGQSKACALRSAQRAVREQYPDRNDWAAYCLTGDFK